VCDLEHFLAQKADATYLECQRMRKAEKRKKCFEKKILWRKIIDFYGKEKKHCWSIENVCRKQGLPDFSSHNTYAKTGGNVPNDNKMFQMAVKFTIWP
jgi:hypothetical protein